MFQYLTLDKRFAITNIKWVKPDGKADLPQYAQQLLPQIPKADKLVLIGVSFGGIMAVELAKILNPALVIQISSVKTRFEMPWYYRLAGKLRLPYLLPLHWGKSFRNLQAFIFGANTTEAKKLLNQIISELDVAYVKWALTAIANWANTTPIPNVVQLHGMNDLIFPAKYIKGFTLVEAGTHLMIIIKAKELSFLINKELDKLLSQQ